MRISKPKTTAIILAAATMLSISLLAASSYAATPTMGSLHQRTYLGNPGITYHWRNGYAGYSYGTAESWMWVKPKDRGVKAGAVCAQAVIDATFTFVSEPGVYYGPWVTNVFPIEADDNVSSYVSFSCPILWTCYGRGSVRNPVTLSHELISTEHNY